MSTKTIAATGRAQRTPDAGARQARRPSAGLLLIAVGVIVAVSLVLVGVGSAAPKAVVNSFGSTSATPALGGTFAAATGVGGVAVNQTTGDVYAVDRGNHRIEQFTAGGTFVRAWGQDVDTAAGTGFEICTVAADCKIGLSTAQTGGALSSPQFVAVDQSDGAVYVTDQGNRRIQKFTATGTFVWAAGWDVVSAGGSGDSASGTFEVCTVAAECKIAATAGANAGQFGSALGSIAVNPGNGQVVVADMTNRRVQRFSATGAFVGAFAWDVVPTGQPGNTGTGLESCPAAAAATVGACQAGVAGSGSGQFAANQPTRLATDSGGAIYTVEGSVNFRVQKFTPTGSSASGFASAATSSTASASAPLDVATDPATDHVYVVRSYASGVGTPPAAVAEKRVLQFDNSGALVDTHAALGAINTVNGIAVASSSAAAGGGAIYLSSTSGQQRVFVLDTPEPPTVSLDPVTIVAGTTATFSGHVDPHGFTTGYHFEYRASATDPWASVPAADADAGPVGSDNVVTQAVTGLEPSTLYAVRLVAAKASGGGSATTADRTFTTLGTAPAVGATAVDSVQDHSARLVGFVDPQGQVTAYHFEYGTADCSAHPCTSVPVPSATAGAGSQPVFAAQAVTGLSPATTYHVRLVVTNATGSTNGPEITFTTRAAPLLIADRAYELVSPADKPGGQGVGGYSNTGTGDIQAAPIPFPSVNGDRVITSSLAGSLVPGSFLYALDYALAEREGDSVGWVSHSPFTHHEYSPNGGANQFFDVQSASADLGMFSWGGTVVARARLFPEMATWPVNNVATYATDWASRWELAAPTDPALQAEGRTLVSAGGTHVLFQPKAKGQLGAADGSLDQLSPALTLYDDDLSAGLSDRFAGNGVRRLVGACTGIGAARTLIPNRDGAGKQGAQICPDPLPGRDARPISNRGASFGEGGVTTRNALSADGQRIWFHSPDPTATGAPIACTGTDAATACPAQLYLSQRGPDGSTAVRWISRSAVANQDATLLGKALYEGAATDGSKGFFRTASPLTVDDRNGTGTAPVTTGTPSATSWDLYRYDVPSGADGHPNGSDPGTGSLTRISAGPNGDGDCNVSLGGTAAALRFASDDGTRAYFTCNAPLPGVPTNTAPTNGTTTTTAGAGTNLYLYDGGKPLADRWEFIAQLPASGPMAGCAKSDVSPGEPTSLNANGAQFGAAAVNCVKGTADGTFVTFATPGQLVAGDPDATTVDVYAFDATADRLIRIDAPQGGAGGSYPCGSGTLVAPVGRCFGDPGSNNNQTPAFSQLGVATKPETPGDRIAFFQSKGRLVPGDVNDQYDVYQWRNGKLSLLSAGTGDKGSFYAGNGASGRDVFVETRDRLTWQDIDGVMDVYDARAGGGIPAPAPGTPACDVLASSCQPAAAPAAFVPQPVAPAPGSAKQAAAPSVTFTVSAVSATARKRLARTGKLTLTVKASGAGLLTARATTTPGGRVTTVARAQRVLSRAGTSQLSLTLSKAARAQLAKARKLTLKVAVSHSRAAASKVVSLRLTQAKAKTKSKSTKKATGSGHRATSNRKGGRS